ncbi:MAG TPA: VOC family protein [Edaphobacter sp.]
MLFNRSMPSATVIPELAYPDLGEAIDWLTRVFGLRLRLRIANHRAQMMIGDGAIVLVEHPRTGEITPIAHSLLVRVPDVDAHHENAVAQGARILRPPMTYPYGEHQYTAADMIGRTWTFSQSVADVDPAEWGGTAAEL